MYSMTKKNTNAVDAIDITTPLDLRGAGRNGRGD
jgi:hypothetical protein